jgi:hypothetical protein
MSKGIFAYYYGRIYQKILIGKLKLLKLAL